MTDPVLISIISGIAGAGFLVGVYSAYLRHISRDAADLSAQQRHSFRFRQIVTTAKIPSLLVFLPLAVTAVLVFLSLGRAGGAPPTRILLMEIGGILAILASIIACATVTGSVVGMYLQETLPE